MADLVGYQKKIFEFLGADPSLVRPIDDMLKNGIELLQPVDTWKEYFTEENKVWFEEYAVEAIKITEDFQQTIS